MKDRQRGASWRKWMVLGALLTSCVGTSVFAAVGYADANRDKEKLLRPVPSQLAALVHEAEELEKFMPVESVRPGMTGIAKTVVEGNTITTFPVKILGIMKNRGPSGDLILAEFSGPLIEKTGGIAHGMSGSPVYIDGKLVGAVAYGWGFSRSHIGMITPIMQMYNLLGQAYRKDVKPPYEPNARLVPLGTPLMAYGFDPATLSFLQDKLHEYQVSAYDTAGTAEDERPQPLYPGSSVAATLIDGDLKLGAIGTVTYVGPKGILAFGHPYLKEGATGYFLHNSYIFTVVNSVESSFKLGSIGANIGAITEDRGAGIAGQLGIAPAFIPVGIRTMDEDRIEEREHTVRVVDDESLTPALVTSAVYNFLTKTMDRKGGGTATISYTISPKDPTQPTYKRKDMFYKANGIAIESVDEFYEILNKLMTNRFVAYPIRSIDVDVNVTEDRRTAQIVDATVTPAVAQPGDDVAVRVELQPFRGPNEFRTLTYTIPKDQPVGQMILEVRGGGVVPLPYLIQKQRLNLTDEVIRRMHTYKTFDEYFKKLDKLERNNQIIVEALQQGVSRVDDGDSTDGSRAKLAPGVQAEHRESLSPAEEAATIEEDDNDRDKVILNTQYVVYRDVQLPVIVTDAAHYKQTVREFIKKRTEEMKAKGKTDGLMTVAAKQKSSKTQKKSETQDAESKKPADKKPDRKPEEGTPEKKSGNMLLKK